MESRKADAYVRVPGRVAPVPLPSPPGWRALSEHQGRCAVWGETKEWAHRLYERIEHRGWWAILAVLTATLGAVPLVEWWSERGLSQVDVLPFLLGILVTLFLGHVGAVWVLALYRKKVADAPDAPRRAMWTGLLERTAMAIAVAASVEAAVVASGALVWIGAKMAANWKSRIQPSLDEPEYSPQAQNTGAQDDEEGNDELEVQLKAMSALLASLVGLSLAVAGGLIIRASLQC